MSQIINLINELKIGKPVGFPTDTVYALAADPLNVNAVEQIFNIKKRSKKKTFALLVSSIEEAQEIVEFNETALKLAKKFWPGALTLILPIKDLSYNHPYICKFQNIALRMPNNKIALEILKEFGSPIVATSANPTGEEIKEQDKIINFFKKNNVSYITDDSHNSGIASTIILVENKNYTILRQGSITEEEIKQVLNAS